jgi:Ribbon-helix-helix protein, copG family
MTMVSFRMEDSDVSAVTRWAEELGLEKSELLREAVRRHLVRLASEADAVQWELHPLSEAEQSLGAIGDWGPAEDWAEWSDATR